jgi:hypothetical protein
MTATWPSGWATGDIVTAAEYKKGVGAIYDTTLGSAAASIDITAIAQAYAHLRVVVYARGDTAATNTNILARFNGDTGANYYTQRLQGNGATASAIEALAQTSMIVGYMPAASASANSFSTSEFVIGHYAQGTNWKTLAGKTAMLQSGGSGNLFAAAIMGGWAAVAAITQITLLPAAGNFATGTRVTVYAMGA